MKFFILVSLLIASVKSYRTGPPSFVCDDPDLKPKHDGNDFQTSPSPFELSVIPGQNFYAIQITATRTFHLKVILSKHNTPRTREMMQDTLSENSCQNFCLIQMKKNIKVSTVKPKNKLETRFLIMLKGNIRK